MIQGVASLKTVHKGFTMNKEKDRDKEENSRKPSLRVGQGGHHNGHSVKFRDFYTGTVARLDVRLGKELKGNTYEEEMRGPHF